MVSLPAALSLWYNSEITSSICLPVSIPFGDPKESSGAKSANNWKASDVTPTLFLKSSNALVVLSTSFNGLSVSSWVGCCSKAASSASYLVLISWVLEYNSVVLVILLNTSLPIPSA